MKNKQLSKKLIMNKQNKYSSIKHIINQAVINEIILQQRPGGLLSRNLKNN